MGFINSVLHIKIERHVGTCELREVLDQTISIEINTSIAQPLLCQRHSETPTCFDTYHSTAVVALSFSVVAVCIKV